MKKLLFYFFVLLIAVWMGLKIAADPGYLLVDYQKTTVEMPLWLAVVILIILFWILYFVFRAISNIRSIKSRFLSWSRARRVRRAWQRSHRGFIALLAGEWKLAEKDLIRAAPYTDTPILNYLGAAYAAGSQNSISQRDEYLGKINPKGKLSELALGLTQAQLQLQQNQYEQALAKLQQLQQLSPKHKIILKLLKKIYVHLEDWGSLEILLPQLEKQEVLTQSVLEKLTRKVYVGLLKNANGFGGAELVYSRITKSLRYSSDILNIYIPMLAKENPDEAEKLVRAALDKSFDIKLLTLYGLLESSYKDKQLKTVEGFLKDHSQDAMLLMTLARLCVKNELWGKARSYFEASLSVAATPQTYQELGQLFEKLGDTQKATECYRKGLMLNNASN